jgi:thiamine transport system substrate-binding protein
MQHRSTSAPWLRFVIAIAAIGLVATACSDDGDASSDAVPSDDAEQSAETDAGGEIVVISHDSFGIDEELLEQFEADTGYTVTLQQGGDAVEIVNQAILTVDDPQGDVLYGVDDATLGRALDNELFVPYESAALSTVRPELVLDDEHRVTPIDYGAVCVNYDAEWFAAEDMDPPQHLDDLREPEYAELLVVENPAASSPGLAFLTATVAEYGEDGWLDYWTDLRDGGVTVASDWTDAYYGRFSGGSGEGDRPLVVSYGSSPPAEVMEMEPLPDEGPTGVVEATCVRQIEFAGVLSNAENPVGAEAFIDFLLSAEFQETIPLNLFVYPAVESVALPEVFERFAVVPDDPYMLDAETIAAGRDTWIDEWTDTVLR